MPTARELLEQADALMRRNRKRGKGRLGDAPTLSDAIGADAPTVAPTVVLPPVPNGAADPIVLDAPADKLSGARDEPQSASSVGSSALHPASDDPISLDNLTDVPVLTDVVVPGASMAAEPPGFVPYAISTPLPVAFAERALQTLAPSASPVDGTRDALRDGDAFPASAAEAQAAAEVTPAPAVIEQEAAVSGHDGADNAAATHSPTPSAASDAQPASAAVDDEFILEIPPSEEPPPPAAPVESAIPAVAAPDVPPPARDSGALAEEIRMQVLQRLDLFTDTGLRAKLATRLQPIVERASAQLIETINRELGELVRAYVAEAIEREIENWRSQDAKPE